MSLNITQVTETPAAPRVETVPSITYFNVNIEVLAGVGSASTVYKGTDVFAGSIQNCVGTRNRLSFQLHAEETEGAILRVSTSYNGLAGGHERYHWWPIIGCRHSWIQDFALPAFLCQFMLVNNSVNTNLVQGILMLRAV